MCSREQGTSYDRIVNNTCFIFEKFDECSFTVSKRKGDTVKTTTGEEPRTTSCNRDGVATYEIIREIVSRFKDHPSIKIIKSHISHDDQKFPLKLAIGAVLKNHR